MTPAIVALPALNAPLRFYISVRDFGAQKWVALRLRVLHTPTRQHRQHANNANTPTRQHAPVNPTALVQPESRTMI